MHTLYSFDKQGTLGTNASITNSHFWLIDSNENLFIGKGNGYTEIESIDTQANQNWIYNSGGNGFTFPFAVTNTGIIYAPTPTTIYAFE